MTTSRPAAVPVPPSSAVPPGDRAVPAGDRLRSPSGWRDAAADALGLVLPVQCVACGTEDRAVCRGCLDDLQSARPNVRLVAGIRLDAAFEYTGVARTLVLALKVHGRLDVARPLGRPMVTLLRRALAESPPGTVVVRVPCSTRGRRRRGFDPLVVLLRRGGASVPPVRLVRVRRRAGGQKSLSALDRVAATVGSLRARDVRGRAVVIVDDVVTTGVTLAEAARAVRAAGGIPVRCVAALSVEPA